MRAYPWELFTDGDERTVRSEDEQPAAEKCRHDWIITLSPILGTKWKDCKHCGLTWEKYIEEEGEDF